MIVRVCGMSHARLAVAAAQMRELPRDTGARRFREQADSMWKGACTAPGCQKDAYCRGLCSAHYIHDYRRRRWPRRYAQ